MAGLASCHRPQAGCPRRKCARRGGATPATFPSVVLAMRSTSSPVATSAASAAASLSIRQRIRHSSSISRREQLGHDDGAVGLQLQRLLGRQPADRSRTGMMLVPRSFGQAPQGKGRAGRKSPRFSAARNSRWRVAPGFRPYDAWSRAIATNGERLPFDTWHGLLASDSWKGRVRNENNGPTIGTGECPERGCTCARSM